MSTHSSTLAWRIPWIEDSGGLQSMGSQRVGHDWATNTDDRHNIFQTQMHFSFSNVCGCVCDEEPLVAQMVKNPPAMQKLGSISGSGRSPEGGHDNLLQCSCLENPMDRGVWWATVHRVAKSQTWWTHGWKLKSWTVGSDCLVQICSSCNSGGSYSLFTRDAIGTSM